MQRDVDAFAPDTRSQSIHGIVGQFHSFSWCAERHCREYRTENFLLGDNRRRMHIAQNCRWKIESPRGQRDLRLPTGCALRYSLGHHALDSFQLDARHDGSYINCLVERWPESQRVHAIADFGDEHFRDAFLHQQARSRTANLTLVEPDSIDQSFNCTIEIGVIEHDERRLPTEFKREALVAASRGSADGTTNLG